MRIQIRMKIFLNWELIRTHSGTLLYFTLIQGQASIYILMFFTYEQNFIYFFWNIHGLSPYRVSNKQFKRFSDHVIAIMYGCTLLYFMSLPCSFFIFDKTNTLANCMFFEDPLPDTYYFRADMWRLYDHISLTILLAPLIRSYCYQCEIGVTFVLQFTEKQQFSKWNMRKNKWIRR